MNRKKPLVAKTPLQRKAALARKTPLLARSALHRKTPLARAAVVARVVKARRPTAKARETASAYAAQRREAVARDGPTCQFELLVFGRWEACGARATQTCHIERRHVCANARAHVDVVLRGCAECHARYDSRLADDVRVPLERRRRCYDTIVAMNPRTHPPGERP